MALATPWLPFLPLAPKQILLNNFLSDIPSLAISGDNVDPDGLSQPQRWSIRDIQHFMIVFGLISSVFDLGRVLIKAGLLMSAQRPTAPEKWHGPRSAKPELGQTDRARSYAEDVR